MNPWLRWYVTLAVSFVAAPLALAQSVVLDTGGIEFPNGSLQPSAASPATAPLPRSGQSTCYDTGGSPTACGSGVGLGQEGHLQPGVVWPSPRFTKNGDGTVTDNLTTLVWLENAHCAATEMNFDAALAFASSLWDGSTTHNGGDCGLSDLSTAGEWRLPNLFELASLLHHEYNNPGLANTAGTGQFAEGHPFTAVQQTYWTSSFNPQNHAHASTAWFQPPFWSATTKSTAYAVWPVRDSRDAAAAAQEVAIKLADGGIEFPDGSLQSTAAGPPRIRVPKTGQTSCWTNGGALTSCGGTGQDGELQAGVEWPDPRFTNRGDGTVRDNLTGLVWAEDANCKGAQMTWTGALNWAATLHDGSVTHGGAEGDCGLADGSIEGQWRLPTFAEFLSLSHLEFDNPAISNADGTGQWAQGDPFLDVVLGNQSFYWTSTSVQSATHKAWVGFARSQVAPANDFKVPGGTAAIWYAWPVRSDE